MIRDTYSCGHPRTKENTRGRREPRCKQCSQEAARSTRDALKLLALNHYGGPVCVDCSSEDFLRLGLDHINEDGRAHREAIMMDAHGGMPFYRALRDLGWPTEPPLQVRCRSCNTRKYHQRRHNR